MIFVCIPLDDRKELKNILHKITPTLETTTTELFARRNPVRTGIHLAAFTAYTIGTSYALTENLDNPYVQLTLPALIFGQVAGLWAVQEVTARCIDKVSRWYHR